MIEVESEIIDVDDINEVEKESLVMGRLVTDIEHWNHSNLIDAITNAWKLKHGMSWKEFEESKLILFCFNHVMDREWVLKNQPWLFSESLFAIKKFTRGDEQSVNVTSFWARLYDVPFSCMNETTLSLFAKQIGILESVDISGEDLIGIFIRFKVSINITEPLLRGITIRVKGDHLWLPLMYESLPIYCFSCGTIGHDYNNCPHYDPILKYSNLKWTASCSKTPNVLPHDIVENILSRLPVKYLLRYKLVCKQWNVTISDPRFAETHLQQQYNYSSSPNLLACEKSTYRSRLFLSLFSCQSKKYSPSTKYSVLQVSELETHNLNYVSTIRHSWICCLRSYNILGYCDGLYLIRCSTLYHEDEVKLFAVWNPSCRAYKEIWCPPQIGDYNTLFGIYYDPLMKDYKVVMGDMKYYAVFSCRSNKWSEVKETKDISWHWSPSDEGVSVNGTLYWLVRELFEKDILICFDWKDEKFKKLALPVLKYCSFKLSFSRGHVCLWEQIGPDQIIIMKNQDDDKGSWMEFKVQLPPEFCTSDVNEGPNLVCWISEEEFIVYYSDTIGRRFHIFYNLRNGTSTSIHTDPLPESFYYSPPLINNNAVPYLENLFLQ